MTEPGSQRELVEKLAEEFVERYRRGERPSLAEYLAAYPDQAEEIRAVFPALVMIEELAPGEESFTAGRPGQRRRGVLGFQRQRGNARSSPTATTRDDDHSMPGSGCHRAGQHRHAVGPVDPGDGLPALLS